MGGPQEKLITVRGEEIEISLFPGLQKRPEWRPPWNAVGTEKVFMPQDGPGQVHRSRPRQGLVEARPWRVTEPWPLGSARERRPSEQEITRSRRQRWKGKGHRGPSTAGLCVRNSRIWGLFLGSEKPLKNFKQSSETVWFLLSFCSDQLRWLQAAFHEQKGRTERRQDIGILRWLSLHSPRPFESGLIGMILFPI